MGVYAPFPALLSHPKNRLRRLGLRPKGLAVKIAPFRYAQLRNFFNTYIPPFLPPIISLFVILETMGAKTPVPTLSNV